ncbi:hypothetical protein [Diaphorobacter aerolatus]|uniref:Uncharacterized protein n=1 Tax=Diaphorobacter aerolatus TaxID=1288495 RepID=A0A7H0GFY7_9BURK|nr:hypothetical protein [Diaphorobacter aerolatus]QNP47203.1 hypothetical protein H9K75_12430 [Diaphorobacter aerolatus]
MRRQSRSQAPVYVGLMVFVICWILSSAAHAWQSELGDRPGPWSRSSWSTASPSI